VETVRRNGDEKRTFVREMAIQGSSRYAEALADGTHRHARSPSLGDHDGGFGEQSRPKIPMMIRPGLVGHKNKDGKRC
jgi:hypothetical protein